jgi:hypothetical protein
VTYTVEADLVPGTEISQQFRCSLERGGQRHDFDPLDTLSGAAVDAVEAMLLDHSARSAVK